MLLLKKLFKITDKGYLNALSQAGTIGLHMVSGITVGTLAGYFLDEWLETSPWLTLIFMVMGIVAGFKNVYVDTKRLIATQRESDPTVPENAELKLSKAPKTYAGPGKASLQPGSAQANTGGNATQPEHANPKPDRTLGQESTTEASGTDTNPPQPHP